MSDAPLPPQFYVGVTSPWGFDPPDLERHVARALSGYLVRRHRTHAVTLVTSAGRPIDRAALAAAQRYGWAHLFYGPDADRRHWLHLAATCQAVVLFHRTGERPCGELRAACEWAGTAFRAVAL